MMTDLAVGDPPKWVISEAGASDVSYVVSCWGRDYEMRCLPSKPTLGFLKAIAPHHARLIKCSTVLAAKVGDKMLGFIVFESVGVLHWIYVRKEHREKGIGSALLKEAGLSKPTVTAITRDLRHLGLSDAPFEPFPFGYTKEI